ncbi:cytidine deaminase [Coraliomargarita akajimensis]|uniref:CMP/dCMP deaminase zinc-binding protein n=1 Tax=Coraliomargarita akajimensis (strain DSM 45221 / IAM 15411 / JCM 23193 / KCTC 12865 / 04OKA010-24) TaxID=583355 RepID=D5EK80_CORAD|nr:cytidine deaminase [Coraliomargarita akajimensis]ADE54829.1 CMP/dCMP deaminase zinc-binding protein [Coraliomargarita akajimensis DSM 45221]
MTLSQATLSPALSKLDKATQTQVLEQLTSPNFSGYLKNLKGSRLTLAKELLDLAQTFSVPPLSGFRVGAVAIGSSGHLYLGANLEFAGVPLSCSLHAEQSAVLNAWMHGEPAIEALVISEFPCGHCRQFLWELSGASKLCVHIGNQSHQLIDLLPHPFGTERKLGHGLLDSPSVQHMGIQKIESDLAQRALNAAERSYTPYTQAHSGFVIECTDGKFYAGRTAESVAFNPSVLSAICALNSRNLSASRDYTINACMQTRLVTSVNSQCELAKMLMQNVTTAKIQKVLIEPAE